VGEIDAATAPVLATSLADAAKTAAPFRPVVADLRQVQFFGSRGIATLVAIHHQCQQLGTSLHIVAGPSVTKRLEQLGLLKALTVRQTMAEASTPASETSKEAAPPAADSLNSA
jgi:anti-anti-sigma factor